MRKIEVEVSTNKVGSEQILVFDVADDANDETINELAWQMALDMINFTWREL